MDIKFLHSGTNNKNPDLDLGGFPSVFEIASNSLNNLFSDITPEEDAFGFIDYRCFYIKNIWSSLYLTSPILSLTQGSDIKFGVLLQDDVQRFTFLGGNPDSIGYIIVSCEFGIFKVDYSGSFANMATDFQTKLRLLPYCSSCTVNLSSNDMDVTFTDDCGTRNTSLMTIVANRLQNTQGGDFIIDTYVITDFFNNKTDTQIKVTDNIDAESFPASGTVYVFNVATDSYLPINYSSYALNIFQTGPLPINLLAYDHLYIAPLDNKEYLVKLRKITQGSPINTISTIIENATTAPDNIIFDTVNIDLGTIFAVESFPVWIKRTTTANSPPILDSFALNLEGTLKSA